MNKKVLNNLTIDNLIKTEWVNQFNKEQQEEILLGIKSKVDIFSYAKPENSSLKMQIKRLQLELGIDKDLERLISAQAKLMNKLFEK